MKVISFACFTLFFSSLYGQQEGDTIGAIKMLSTAVCRIDVSKGTKKIHHVYPTPFGWQILSYKPVLVSLTPGAAYSIIPTPSNFSFTSTSAIYSKFIELLEFAAEKNVFQKYEGKINRMRTFYEQYFTKKPSTYSTITALGSVSAISKNAKKAGRLYLDLEVTLINLPHSEEEFLQSLEQLKQVIASEG